MKIIKYAALSAITILSAVGVFMLLMEGVDLEKYRYLAKTYALSGIDLEKSYRYPPPEYTGKWIMRYRSGSKLYAGEYIEGFEEGVWTHWRENGVKLYDVEFRKGKAHGIKAFYDENGLIESIEKYESGRRIEVLWERRR